jgi:hypothetical protein
MNSLGRRDALELLVARTGKNEVFGRDNYQGLAEVDLKLLIGTNGLVQKVEITKATNAGIGDRVAASARNWIFVPYEQDGVLHPASMNVKLQIQAIKSK